MICSPKDIAWHIIKTSDAPVYLVRLPFVAEVSHGIVLNVKRSCVRSVEGCM